MSARRPYIPAGCDQQGRVLDGRRALTLSERCQEELAEIRAARNAGIGMACAGATTSPGDLAPLRSWPWGPSRPGKLTEAELDAHNAEMHPSPAPRMPRIAPRVMPALSGPYKRATWWRRLWARWRVWRAERMRPAGVVR